MSNDLFPLDYTHTHTLLWASCEPVANALWGESTGPHIPPCLYPISMNVPLLTALSLLVSSLPSMRQG